MGRILRRDLPFTSQKNTLMLCADPPDPPGLPVFAGAPEGFGLTAFVILVAVSSAQQGYELCAAFFDIA